jgi:MFS transporter, ACDE family, multidrug resistance protein
VNRTLAVSWRDPVLCFLLVAGSLTVMAGAVMAPILPELIVHLHLSRDWAGSLVSVHYLTLALFSPILGVVADRHGQLRVLIPCLLGYAVVGASGAFLPDYFTLLVARGLVGVASGGIAASSLGLLSRRYEGEARNQAIAYAATAITLANIVYPLMAVGLGYFNWRLAFGLYGISAVMAGVAPLLFRKRAIATHPESAPNLQRAAAADLQIGALLSSPSSLRVFISLMMVSAIVYGTIIYLPIYLKTSLGSGLLWNGFILAIQAVGAALSSGFLLRPFTRRVGSLRLVGLSLGTMALFLVLFPHLTNLPVLMAVSGLFGVSFGLITPSLYTLLANLAPAHLQSSILATGIGAGFLGQFVSPLILGGILSASGLTGVFYSCAVAAIALGLSLLIPLKPKPIPANGTHIR